MDRYGHHSSWARDGDLGRLPLADRLTVVGLSLTAAGLLVALGYAVAGWLG